VEVKLSVFLSLTLFSLQFVGPDVHWIGLRMQILRPRGHRLKNDITMELKEILWLRIRPNIINTGFHIVERISSSEEHSV
jgi:hypothetical protein